MIDLGEAIEIALRQSVQLRQAEQQVDRARTARGAARLDLFPSLSASTYGSQRYGLAFDQTVGELTQQRTRSLSGGLSASMTLFDGFRRIAELQQAGRNVDAAEHRRVRSRQDVVHTTIERFLQVALDREQVRIRTQSLEAQRTQRRQVQNLVDAGRRPESDLLQQEERVATARMELLRSRQEVEVSRARLIQTLHLDPLGTYEFETPSPDELGIDTTAAPVDRLISRAVERRSDLAAQRAEVQAAQADVSVARSRYWPSVHLSGGIGTSFTSAIDDVEFSEQFDRNRSGSIGLNLSIPLTGWLSAKKQAEQARASRRSAELEAERLGREIATQVREAHLNQQALTSQLRAAETRIQAAEAALAAAEDRYRLGRAPIQEVADVRARYVEARSALAQTRYRLLLQEATLAYRTGAIDASILPSTSSTP